MGYEGPTIIQRRAPNLKFRVGNPTILCNKVMKEVKLCRFARPFSEVPFKNFVQSPIGLVSKDHGRDTKLIFHLSYPRDGKSSVNANTPAELCKVNYVDFDEAIKMCIDQMSSSGICYLSKSDTLSAFRNLGLCPSSWNWLVMKARSPLDNKMYYFVDKCLPFGSSISCALFQEVSDAVAFIVRFRTRRPLVNYLDNYLFVAALKVLCNQQLNEFLHVCAVINQPISKEKTITACTQLTFLGFLVDGKNCLVLVPVEKVHKANELISEFLTKKKTTIRRLQQLCGFLNFLCRAVVPGGAFTRRLYSKISPKLKPHHHINSNAEMKMDLRVRNTFLANPSVFSRPFADFSGAQHIKVDLYTDASKNPQLGYGA